jgi:hypothetical protein
VFFENDNDKTKNIIISKGLSIVCEDNNIEVWTPSTTTNSGVTNQIRINYGFRAMAATACILFCKPGDIINSGNTSSN